MSGFYTIFKNDLMKGLIDLETANVTAALVDTADYTFSDTHETFDQIPSTAIVGLPTALTGKAVVNDRFNADNLFFDNVTGDTAEGVVFYIDSGVPASSRLMLFSDNAGTFSVTPSGVGINIIFNSNPPGSVFRL